MALLLKSSVQLPATSFVTLEITCAGRALCPHRSGHLRQVQMSDLDEHRPQGFDTWLHGFFGNTAVQDSRRKFGLAWRERILLCWQFRVPVNGSHVGSIFWRKACFPWRYIQQLAFKQPNSDWMYIRLSGHAMGNPMEEATFLHSRCP
jgi:hypothetical protein